MFRNTDFFEYKFLVELVASVGKNIIHSNIFLTRFLGTSLMVKTGIYIRCLYLRIGEISYSETDI